MPKKANLRGEKLKKIIRLLRVQHYLKNLLIFAALASSGQMLNKNKLLMTAIGFCAFCAISSSVYIINDIRDVEKDKAHPKKCKRPIASGDISLTKAYVILGIAIAIAVAFSILTFNLVACILILIYLVLNIGYSYGLKNIPIIDIVILAAGFLIRLLYGAKLADIEVSSWLLLTVMTISFYFALGKRRNELKLKGENDIVDDTRVVLKHYPLAYLDKTMYMCLGLFNTFYTLWSLSDNTVLRYNNKYLFWTSPIVLVITMKYNLNVETKLDGDPVEILLQDKALIALCALYLFAMFFILYLLK